MRCIRPKYRKKKKQADFNIFFILAKFGLKASSNYKLQSADCRLFVGSTKVCQVSEIQESIGHPPDTATLTFTAR